MPRGGKRSRAGGEAAAAIGEEDGAAAGAPSYEDDEFGAGSSSSSSSSAAAASGGSTLPFGGVVKVFVSHARPNFSLPWSMRAPVRSVSSGFCIKDPKLGPLVLTNAHCVTYHSLVQVRKYGSAEKETARVLAIAHDCDVALLQVDSANWWKGTKTLKFGPLPYLHSSIIVCGFPMGGDQISVTSGVVSRIDFGMYAHSSRDHLVLQTDSAINSGNSGGPCFSADGGVIGIAFQSLDASEAEGIGFVIPAEVVTHVLSDVARTGTAQPFGRLGFQYQLLENPHLKNYLRVPAGSGGVVVSKVVPISTCAVQHNDVILAIDSHAVADDGTIVFRGEERIAFGSLFNSKFIGSPVTLSLFRDGAKKTVTVPLEVVPDLVPKTLYEQRPQYLVHCGLVFTPLSEPYLQSTYTREWETRAPVRFVHLAYHSIVERPGQQVVILASILSNAVVVGYEPEEFGGLPLAKLNDMPINNLVDLALAIDQCTDTYLRFEFEGAKTVIVPRELSIAASAEVLSQHAIATPMSVDIAAAVKAAQEARAGKGAGAMTSSSSSSSKAAAAAGAVMAPSNGGRSSRRGL